MDGSTRAVGQYANGSEKPSVASFGLNPRAITVGLEVSVVILYADAVIAAGLAVVLREHGGFRIVAAQQPGQAEYGAPPADVVLADYDTALRLAKFAPHWVNNTLIFTNYDSEAKICRALESGARGYLLYGAGLTELVAGIRSVREGRVALSPLVAARITNRVQGERLTAREESVLEQLMARAAQRSHRMQAQSMRGNRQAARQVNSEEVGRGQPHGGCPSGSTSRSSALDRDAGQHCSRIRRSCTSWSRRVQAEEPRAM